MDETERPTQKITVNKYLSLLRPRHWVKNLFVFAPLLFSKSLNSPALLLLSIYAFLCYCLSASTVYIINDLRDIDNDRKHPVKKIRPLASGLITTYEAKLLILILLPATIADAFILDGAFGLTVLVYFINNLLYTLYFKKLAVIDVMSIAAGFLLRVAGGAAVINANMSPWLIICTFLLALFLGLTKRKNELKALGTEAYRHRVSLKYYTLKMTDIMLSLTALMIILSYSMYSVFSSRGWYYIFNVAFVVCGIARFRYLSKTLKATEGPEEVVLGDDLLLIDIALWILSNIIMLYG